VRSGETVSGVDLDERTLGFDLEALRSTVEGRQIDFQTLYVGPGQSLEQTHHLSAFSRQ
jgi:hypothetical protein